MSWIIDELPEEHKMLLVYDIFKGLNIAYYDALDSKFYCVYQGVVLDTVCAWMYAPDKPKIYGNVISKVRERNSRNVIVGSSIR